MTERGSLSFPSGGEGVGGSGRGRVEGCSYCRVGRRDCCAKDREGERCGRCFGGVCLCPPLLTPPPPPPPPPLASVPSLSQSCVIFVRGGSQALPSVIDENLSSVTTRKRLERVCWGTSVPPPPPPASPSLSWIHLATRAGTGGVIKTEGKSRRCARLSLAFNGYGGVECVATPCTSYFT